MRRSQQIDADLRKLRADAERAQLAEEGRYYHLRPHDWKDDGKPVVMTNEFLARALVLMDLNYIENRLDDDIIGCLADMDVDDLIDLHAHLNRLSEDVKKAVRESTKASLNELSVLLRVVKKRIRYIERDKSYDWKCKSEAEREEVLRKEAEEEAEARRKDSEDSKEWERQCTEACGPRGSARTLSYHYPGEA